VGPPAVFLILMQGACGSRFWLENDAARLSGCTRGLEGSLDSERAIDYLEPRTVCQETRRLATIKHIGYACDRP
jgi:hypothetical protein